MSAGFILADDLSGALEAGVAFHARGWRTVVPCGDAAPADLPASALRVISTETRLATPAVARTRVQELLQAQARSGEPLRFKKIDSTLRGPWGAELQAVMEVLRPRTIVVCPANPAMQRTVTDGKLRVAGVSLEQTDFRHDPAWPAVTGSIRQCLASQGVTVDAIVRLDAVRGGGLPAALARLPENRTRIVVVDAESEDDLRRLVTDARTSDAATVFVGSGALGDVLARDESAPSDGPRSSPLALSSLLFLCGSRHPTSHRQLACLAEKRGAAILRANLECPAEKFALTVRAALERNKLVGLHADPAASISPEALTVWLGRLAQALDELGALPAGIFLTGGETAFAICRQLGGVALTLDGAPVTGVVRAILQRKAGDSRVVFTKPGGFGAEDALVDLADLEVK